MRGRVGRGAVAAVAAALMLGGATVAAAGQPLPSPGISPPGANDPGCRPAAPHPDPVVLVHGTYGDMTVSWNLLSPVLRDHGYCVFALDYGHRGTDPVEQSAAQLGAFVDQVLATTGASRVLIVGHSQGGMMPRYWMRFLGGAGKVRGLVGLAPSNHGTVVPAAALAGDMGCTACDQQIAGSDFLTRLNAGGDTLPGVSYTVVETRFDEVVIPWYYAYLRGPRVTNVTLQEDCARDRVEHLGIIYDPVAVQWVVDALDHAGLADPEFRPVC
ncbi:MAG TPA: alpha/beta fold hydrolase [Candidatus Dormibacteraeota bacterium]